ncbi:MAG TPA: PEP-CTERM sorting domain-containing protein [Tepidisphaeraceae bacterium]|nr:PEP-CTERM sorting domain-containing protein [Tepidisphaeraceae bacterium]
MNFNGRAHGEIVDDYYKSSKGVTISAANSQGGPNIAIAFDTTRTRTDDADLEDPWNMGNLVGTTLWKILILAENDIDANGDGRIDRPDDQGSQPHLGSAGQLIFDFDLPQQSLGVDLIDVEDGDYTIPPDPQTAGDQVGYIGFYLLGAEVRRVSLHEFVNPSSDLHDPSVVYGDNSANRIQEMTAEELNIVAYDKLVFDMGMCYGIDSLVFQEFTGAVPEPSSLAWLGLGAALLARRARRR